MSKKRRSPELAALQEAFKLDVLFGGDPDGRPLPCWYAENIPGAGGCDGRPRASHFLKRRRVEKLVEQMLWGIVGRDSAFEGWRSLADDLVPLAAWDPRNAVPSCARHDDIWDSNRAPLPSEQLQIYDHLVPLDVALFVLDWGIEHELERRCPGLFLPSVWDARPTPERRHISTLEIAKSERALFDG